MPLRGLRKHCPSSSEAHFLNCAVPANSRSLAVAAAANARPARKPPASVSRSIRPVLRHSVLGEVTPHTPLSAPYRLQQVGNYDPSLLSATDADSVARFQKLAAALLTTPELVTLPDLLFLLSTRLHAVPTPLDLLGALYGALLAVPATRLVLSVLHYNHLLAHCVRPSTADEVPAPPPLSTERVAFGNRVVEDMKALGIEKDAQTHAMLLLFARRRDADLQVAWTAIPTHLRKQLPAYAYNLMLERELAETDLSNSALWKWYTAIQRSPAAQPSVYTYELLLRGFGPRLQNADAVVRKILPKLDAATATATGLEWRRATFAAVLEASAVCGADEKWYNRVLHRLRIAGGHVDVDETILNAMLRHLLYAGKPVGVLRTYKRLAQRAKTLPTPPGHDTVVLLMEACAAIPGAARPEMRTQALAEAREMLAEIISWLPDAAIAPAVDSGQVELAWSYAAKCAASLHESELVHNIATKMKQRAVQNIAEATPYVPRPLLLAAQALAAGRTRDVSAVRAFVKTEVVGAPAVIGAYYVRDIDVMEQEPFEAAVYENLLLGWMEGGGDGEVGAAGGEEEGLAEIMELMAELRQKEKVAAERVLAHGLIPDEDI
ncbi:hypothetical protein HDU89_007781 [Geranomyces variabilis]|nr:hypothetical protein HDU89_007781 [Geranomyces variabilis]